MPFPDPYNWLSPVARKRIWLISLVMSAALLWTMTLLDGPLRTAAAPSGIISFELAGDGERTGQILSSWDARARMHAALSLGMDYLFLVTYALFISMACAHIARGLKDQVAVIAACGFLLAWAQVAAALLDAVENYALIRQLLGSGGNVYPMLARVCALIKFSLVGMGLAYLPIGYIIGRLGRGR